MNRTTILIAVAAITLTLIGYWMFGQHGASADDGGKPASSFAKILTLKRERDLTKPGLALLTIDHKPGANNEGSITLTGWKLQSRTSGFVYALPAFVGTQYTYKGVPPTTVSELITIIPGQNSRVIIHENGTPAEDSITTTNELTLYHLYIGSTDHAWTPHDTIDLLDTQGNLVASVRY